MIIVTHGNNQSFIDSIVHTHSKIYIHIKHAHTFKKFEVKSLLYFFS